MTSMPPMSSTTASVVRNIFKGKGTREPSRVRTPNENAISVDIGIAAPPLNGVPEENERNIHTGTIIPPIAATIGSRALRNDERYPTRISRLISRPIVKKIRSSEHHL